MKFELKNVEIIGGSRPNSEETSIQLLNITVGPIDCPYIDIVANKIVEYEFSNSLSIVDVKADVNQYAIDWVETNYPEVI